MNIVCYILLERWLASKPTNIKKLINYVIRFNSRQEDPADFILG